MDKPLITRAVNLLLAMIVPPTFLIYPSTTSANWWQTHCPTHHSEAAGPTWPVPTHPPGLPAPPGIGWQGARVGDGHYSSHPPDPSCYTHHSKLQALAPATLLALLVAAPEFGLVTAEVAVATVHPPQAGCTGPTFAVLPTVCVRLLGTGGVGAVTRIVTVLFLLLVHQPRWRELVRH